MNGVFRDREKVMRGMDHKDSAQKLIDAFEYIIISLESMVQ